MCDDRVEKLLQHLKIIYRNVKLKPKCLKVFFGHKTSTIIMISFDANS